MTGGVAGDLDFIDGAGLADGDGAMVITSSHAYTYILDASSGAGESSPNIIAPDTNPGTKRWLLKSMSDQDVSVASSPVFAGGEFTGVVSGVAPVANGDLVTKSYADQLIGAFKTFYLSDTASGVGALDYAYPRETGEAQSTEVSAGMASGDDQLIKGWITEAGEPGTTTLHEGLIEFHFHAKKGAANHRTTQLYGVLSRVDADGTSNKVLVATTEVSDELTDTEATFHLHANVADDIVIADDARLIFDVYANVGAGAVDAVVTLYMEGSQDSFWTTRVEAGIWQNHSDVLDDLVSGDDATLLGNITSNGTITSKATVAAGQATLAIIAGGNNATISRLKMGDLADDNVGMIAYQHGNQANDNQMEFTINASIRLTIASDGGIHLVNLKSGTDQSDAGAVAGELYSDTNDDNTVKIGV